MLRDSFLFSDSDPVFVPQKTKIPSTKSEKDSSSDLILGEMIEIKNLSFSYKEKEIFHDLSVSFPSKGFVILLGRSGSGKTTLLSLLSHQLIPTKGEIIGIDEKPVMVFQSPLLLDYLTVLDNVALPLRLIGKDGREEARKALERIHREHRKDRYPLSLSGGEARRVSLARALITKEKVLILDEPTGQLDEGSSRLVYQTIKEISKDTLVLRVTHDEKNARLLADILYELKGGKLSLRKGIEKSENKPVENKDSRTGSLSLKSSLKRNFAFLRKRKFRVFLSSFFLAFNFTLRYLGLTRRKELPSRTRNRSKEYYASEVAEITEKETIAKSGHRTLKRFSIPSMKTRKRIGIEKSYPSLDYFLPPAEQIRIEKETRDVFFTPARTEKKEKIKEGRRMESFDEVVINENVLKEAGKSFSERIGKRIPIHHQALIYSTQFSSNDRLSLDFQFKIVGLSKEKTVFNQPRIYYSFPLRYEYLSRLELKNISIERKQNTLLVDLLEDINCQEDDFLSRKVLYRTNSPLADKKKAEQLYKDTLQITSPSRTREENRDSVASSLTIVLGAFLLLSLISSIRLLFRIVYSLDEDNIRMFALISVFPGKKGNKRIAAFGMVLFFTFTTGLLFILLSFVSSIIGNNILSYFSLTSLFVRNPVSLFLILALLFIATLFGCFLPLRKIKEGELKSQLEGED